MRIAVVGSGVAGSVAAYRLAERHEVTLFEAEDRLGGHVHTVEVGAEGRRLAVDTGFIVCNEWTYPGFLALLAELGVPTQESTMSFSVSCARTGLEYNGHTLNTLFAQRRNLFKPSFLRMLRAIVRFNREGQEWLAKGTGEPTLAEWLVAGRYPRELVEHYVHPRAAAIWSAATDQVLEMPLRFFLRFFANHGMLSIDRRPTWRVVKGGSFLYMEALHKRSKAKVCKGARVERVVRAGSEVELRVGGESPRFDHVVLATHGDQALAVLSDATSLEKEVLGAFATVANTAILHTDTKIMPRAKRAWAAWNYHLPAEPSELATVTYDMNTLQSLPAQTRFLVTLNRTAAIDPQKILRRMVYRHPVYTNAAVRAQARWAEIDGKHRVSFCGAYWRNGFHEDGLQSALAVVAGLTR